MNELLIKASQIATLILLISISILLLILIIRINGHMSRIRKQRSVEKRTEKVECYNVIGEVLGKDYKSEIEFINNKGNNTGIVIEIYVPEAYTVHVKYAKEEAFFNDKKVFLQYEEGDKIPLVLVMKYDKNGKVIDITLELPE